MTSDIMGKAKAFLDIVVGPDDLVSKVPELGFKKAEDLLKANGFSEVPPLPPEDKLKLAKEQQKALVFRVAKNGEGKDVNLAYLKGAFEGLIYSTWYLAPPQPFASEPLNAGWALVDLEPLPESDEKTYAEQIEFVKAKKTRLKNAAEDAYDLIVAFKVTGKYYRGEPVNGRTATTVADEPVKISHFNKAGMAISKGWGKTVRSGEIGAATELL
jgi:hypothetical protein